MSARLRIMTSSDVVRNSKTYMVTEPNEPAGSGTQRKTCISESQMSTRNAGHDDQFELAGRGTWLSIRYASFVMQSTHGGKLLIMSAGVPRASLSQCVSGCIGAAWRSETLWCLTAAGSDRSVLLRCCRFARCACCSRLAGGSTWHVG